MATHKGDAARRPSSTLAVLLNGREHLARSWTGFPEERCRQQIIVPMWQWLTTALAITDDWPNHALWPLVFDKADEQRPQASFSQPFDWVYRRRIFTYLGPILTATPDPQYPFARGIAFPRALDGAERVIDSVRRLDGAIRRHLASLAAEIVRRHEPLHDLPEEDSDLPIELAYALAEVRW